MPTTENTEISTQPVANVISFGTKSPQVGYVQALIAIANTGQGIIVPHKRGGDFGIDNDYGNATALGLEVIAETLKISKGLVLKDGKVTGYTQEFVSALEAYVAQMSPQQIRQNSAIYLNTVSDGRQQQQKAQLEKAVSRFPALSKNVLPLTADFSKVEMQTTVRRTDAVNIEENSTGLTLNGKAKQEALDLGNTIITLDPTPVQTTVIARRLIDLPQAPVIVETAKVATDAEFRAQASRLFDAVQAARSPYYIGASGNIGDKVEVNELIEFAVKQTGLPITAVGSNISSFIDYVEKNSKNPRLEYTREQFVNAMVCLQSAPRDVNDKAQNFALQLTAAQKQFEAKNAKLPVKEANSNDKQPTDTPTVTDEKVNFLQ